MHLIDHLDEIDRRGLALRRGYSSLFDYAVRELGFSDASAQRRIQTMRLCRRHGWVRAELQSGKFDLTSAALLETAFAGAERQGRSGRGPAGGGSATRGMLECRRRQREWRMLYGSRAGGEKRYGHRGRAGCCAVLGAETVV